MSPRPPTATIRTQVALPLRFADGYTTDARLFSQPPDILTLINVLGVRGSARFAIALTGLKYAAIGAIIVLGVVAAIRQMLAGDTTSAHFVATAPPILDELILVATDGDASALKAAAERGWIDERAAAMETLTGIKRAGADLIITYFAPDMAKWLRN